MSKCPHGLRMTLYYDMTLLSRPSHINFIHKTEKKNFKISIGINSIKYDLRMPGIPNYV